MVPMLAHSGGWLQLWCNAIYREVKILARLKLRQEPHI
jgi:hypothetical protein